MENNKPKRRTRIGLYAMWMSLGVVVAGTCGYAIAAAVNQGDAEATKEHTIDIIKETSSNYEILSDKTQAKKGDVVVFTVKTKNNSASIPASLKISSTKEGEESLYAEYTLTPTASGDYEAKVVIMFTSNMKVELRLENHLIVTFSDNDATGTGAKYTTVNVKENEYVSKPLDPKADGKQFLGWYDSSTEGTQFDFTTSITEDKTLFAHWGEVTKIDFGGTTSIEFDVDDEAKSWKELVATITSSGSVQDTLIWKSSDDNVAYVEATEGTNAAKVYKNISTTATCVITATSSITPSVSASCTVNITNNTLKYTPIDSTTCSVSAVSTKVLTGNVSIPETVTISGNKYTVTKIDSKAFENQSKITSISIPSTITTIESGDFVDGCSKLESFYVDAGNSNFKSSDGILFSSDLKKLISYPANKTVGGSTSTYYTIPSTVTTIGSYAFADTNIKGVHIPNTVTALEPCWLYTSAGAGELTFENNYANWQDIDGQIKIVSSSPSTTFTNFSNHDKVVNLHATDFCGFYVSSYDTENMTCGLSLNEETMPDDGVVSIPEYIVQLDRSGIKTYKVTDLAKDYDLEETSRLTSIRIPETMTEIPDYLFCPSWSESGQVQYYSNLQIVILPSTIERIGEYSFQGCTGLKTINIPSSLRTIDVGAFSGCTSLNSLEFPSVSNLTRIRSYAFYGCTSLTFANKLPTTITEIEDHAFYDCESLQKITLSFNLTKLGSYAFANCSNAFSGTVTIPPSLNEMGANPFASCSNITDFNLYDNYYYYLDSNGFVCESETNKLIMAPAKPSMSELVLDDEIRIIGEDALYGCTFNSVTIGKNVSILERYALQGLYTLHFEVDEDNLYFKICEADGNLYDLNTKELLGIVANSTYDAIVTLEKIAPSVGYDCSFLNSVHLNGASNLTSIGRYAFGYLPEGFIEGIDLSECTNLTTIEYGAFSGFNDTLEVVKIPASVTFCEGFYDWNNKGINKVYCDSSDVANMSYPYVFMATNTIYLEDSIVAAGLSDESYIVQYFTEGASSEGYTVYTRRE